MEFITGDLVLYYISAIIGLSGVLTYGITFVRKNLGLSTPAIADSDTKGFAARYNTLVVLRLAEAVLLMCVLFDWVLAYEFVCMLIPPIHIVFKFLKRNPNFALEANLVQPSAESIENELNVMSDDEDMDSELTFMAVWTTLNYFLLLGWSIYQIILILPL